MKRILGVDVDGVLADFNSAFIDLIVEVAHRDLFPPRPFDIPVWNYPERYGYGPEEMSAVWASINGSSSFWQTLPTYPETIAAMRYLRSRVQAGDDVYFVTNRSGATAKIQTERWLRRFEFGSPTVLITSAKGLIAKALKFDVYVDDRVENILDVRMWSKDTRAVLFDRPWNQSVEGFERTRTVELS